MSYPYRCIIAVIQNIDENVLFNIASHFNIQNMFTLIYIAYHSPVTTGSLVPASVHIVTAPEHDHHEHHGEHDGHHGADYDEHHVHHGADHDGEQSKSLP